MSFSVDMERGDQRQSLALRILVLEVPALKIGSRPIYAVTLTENIQFYQIARPLYINFAYL